MRGAAERGQSASAADAAWGRPWRWRSGGPAGLAAVAARQHLIPFPVSCRVRTGSAAVPRLGVDELGPSDRLGDDVAAAFATGSAAARSRGWAKGRQGTALHRPAPLRAPRLQVVRPPQFLVHGC